MTTEHWSEFWKEGHPTTFGNAFNNNYEGDIAKFWLEIFVELSSNTKIHDLAAGSGAIARLAENYSSENGQSFKISANDFADIDLTQLSISHAELINIEFHNRTSNDNLPFNDGSLNLVVSQYGFEYSPLISTVNEINRVLQSNGRFIAIVHSENSELIIESIRTLNFLKRLKTEYNFQELIVKFSTLVGDINKKEELSHLKFNTKLEKVRLQVNDLVNEFINNYSVEFQASENLAYLQMLFNHKMIGSVQARLDYCDFISHQNEIYIERLEEMTNASYDCPKILKLEKLVTGLGSLTLKDFKDSQGRNLGKVIYFKKY